MTYQSVCLVRPHGTRRKPCCQSESDPRQDLEEHIYIGEGLRQCLELGLRDGRYQESVKEALTKTIERIVASQAHTNLAATVFLQRNFQPVTRFGNPDAPLI